MSASVDQRSKEQVSNGIFNSVANRNAKEPKYEYMHALAMEEGYSSEGGPAAYVNPYYSPYMPYHPGRGDINSGGWGRTDPLTMQYMNEYSQLALSNYPGGGKFSQVGSSNEYGGSGAMIDYGAYGGYGWFPNGGDEVTAWGNVQQGAATPAGYRNDPRTAGTAAVNSYDANGYYSIDPSQSAIYEINAFYGRGSGDNEPGREADMVSSAAQGIAEMNIGKRREVDAANGNHGVAEYPTGARMANAHSKPTTWARVASQPADKPRGAMGIPPAPLQPNKERQAANNASLVEGRNESSGRRGPLSRAGAHEGWAASRKRQPVTIVPGSVTVMQRPSSAATSSTTSVPVTTVSNISTAPKSVPSKPNPPPAVAKLRQYNPRELDDTGLKNARFFIIKSYSEDDIHRSIKYAIWCSTEYGNRRLDSAWRERQEKGTVYLFFSVNGSGHFCGVAEMTTAVDYEVQSAVWAQSKWRGQFGVKWIYVKDVPNSQLRHIRLENNEGKPVTNSRDTQEVPPDKGRQVFRIIHQYQHTTSIFDDFGHYEKRQEEEGSVKKVFLIDCVTDAQ